MKDVMMTSVRDDFSVRQHAEQTASQPDSQPKKMTHAACRFSWARLLAKVIEINSLVCPCCGSEMKTVALITIPAQAH